MDLASIVCEYIYGAFKIIKASVEALLDVFEILIEKLYSLAITINNAIFTVLGKALDAILLIVVNALNSHVSAMNQSFGGTWSFCAPAFGCNFFLEQILDPNSLIAKTIRKILEGKDNCFCRKTANGTTYEGQTAADRSASIYDIQQTLFDIATDYENFKSQICNGLSLDLANDMVIDLCLGYLGQLNGWKSKIEGKLKMLKKKLQDLIDKIRNSGLFKLLEQIQAFFECVLDTELCANVDTAKSFYQYTLTKLGLVEAGVGEYILSKNFENEILGTANSFLAKVNEGIKKVEGILGSLSCPVSVKGASNALDLTSTIKGIGGVANDLIKGDKPDWNRIPIIDYSNKKIEELTAAYERLHEKRTLSEEGALKMNKCYTLNDVLLETVAEGEPVDYIDVEPGADTSHAQDIIQVGDKFYTVADAAKQLYTGEGDPDLINLCRRIGGYLDVNDIVTRY